MARKLGPQLSDNNAIPPTNSYRNQTDELTLDQIESQLNKSQPKILSELKKQVQQGDLSRQDIGELLRELKKSTSSRDFARQLDKAGEKLDLPAKSREEMQQWFNGLSRLERSAVQQAVDEVDDGLLDQLANQNEKPLGNRRDSTERD